MKFDDNSMFFRSLDQTQERIMKQRELDLGADLINEINKAIFNKDTIYDREKNRIIAFTLTGPVVINKKAIGDISGAARDSVQRLIRNVNMEDEKDASESLTAILRLVECFYSSGIDTKELIEARKMIFQHLKGMMNSNDKNQVDIAKMAIVGFVVFSKDPIKSGRQNHPGISTPISNEKEKRYFRNKYISEFLREGVVDAQFLAEVGVFDDLTIEEFEEIYKNSHLFSEKQLFKVLISMEFEDPLQKLAYMCQNTKKEMMDKVNSEQLVQLMLVGNLSPRDIAKKLKIEEMQQFSPDLIQKLLQTEGFPRGTVFLDFSRKANGSSEVTINKELLMGLSREALLSVIFSKDIKYKHNLTSEDLVRCYGKLKMDDISLLETIGMVDSEDIIRICRFARIDEGKGNEFQEVKEDIGQYYDFYEINELLRNGKINSRFIEDFNYFTNACLNIGERRAYFRQIINDMHEIEDGERAFVALVKCGLKVPQNLDYRISEDTIIEMYTDDELIPEDFVSLYNSGIIKLDLLKDIFTDDELIELFEDGKINHQILNILDNRESYIKNALDTGKLDVPQIIDLYSHEQGLNIEEFKNIIGDYDCSAHNLSEYIQAGISPEKVEDLFREYYISHDDLSALVTRKIITEEQYKEFSERLNSHEEYKRFFGGNGIVKLTSETDGEPTGPRKKGPGKGPRKSPIDSYLQEAFFEEIGFTDKPLILEGYNNTLNGYRIYPSEEIGLIVFCKPGQPNNATYIMSLQQGMFLLTQIERNGKREEGIETGTTKKELRQSEHVKIRNLCKKWGANVLEDMRKISPVLDDKMRNQSTYAKNIESIVKEIREDYKSR